MDLFLPSGSSQHYSNNLLPLNSHGRFLNQASSLPNDITTPITVSLSPSDSHTMSTMFPATPAGAIWRPAARTRKRKHDENSQGDDVTPVPIAKKQKPPPKSARASPKTDEQKMTLVLAAIKDANWTISEFLFQFFRHGKDVSRGKAHANSVQKFLSGATRYSPCDIIKTWIHSPEGAEYERLRYLLRSFLGVHIDGTCDSGVNRIINWRVCRWENSHVISNNTEVRGTVSRAPVKPDYLIIGLATGDYKSRVTYLT